MGTQIAGTAEQEAAARAGDLEALAGEWEGTVRTWFRPEDPVDTSPVRARIRTVVPPDPDAGAAGSGFVLYEYSAATGGEPQEGVAIFGFGPGGAPVSAWVDGFHMSGDVMVSRGAPPLAGAPGGEPGVLSVLGHYADPSGGPDWGWRTELRLVDPDHLVVTAYNIPPGVEEVKAVEADYTRRR